MLKVKVKAVNLYSTSSCMPKAGGQAGGQATSNVLSSRARSRWPHIVIVVIVSILFVLLALFDCCQAEN